MIRRIKKKKNGNICKSKAKNIPMKKNKVYKENHKQKNGKYNGENKLYNTGNVLFKMLNI